MKVTLISILFWLASCAVLTAQEASGGNQVKLHNEEKRSVKTFYWVSELYLKCMKNHLPCECMDIVDAQFCLLVYDTDKQRIDAYENGGEIRTLVLKKERDGSYNVYASSDEPPFFSIAILNDILYLKKDNKTYKYINYSKIGDQYSDENILGKLNLKLVTDNLRSAPKFLKKGESACLYCNKGLGAINLISTPGNCEGMLILENKKNKLWIYDYLNSCEGKSYPVNIKKKLVYTIQKK